MARTSKKNKEKEEQIAPETEANMTEDQATPETEANMTEDQATPETEENTAEEQIVLEADADTTEEQIIPETEVPVNVERIMQLYPQYEKLYVTKEGFVHPEGSPKYLVAGATLYTNKYYNNK